MKNCHLCKLIIDGKLPGLNEYISSNRKNAYCGASLKKNAQQICEMSIRSQLRGVHIEKPVMMRYRWIESNRKRDLDNISSFGRKIIQDALVNTKVLKNDGWKEIVGFSDEFLVDAKRPRIEVLIEEADEK